MPRPPRPGSDHLPTGRCGAEGVGRALAFAEAAAKRLLCGWGFEERLTRPEVDRVGIVELLHPLHSLLSRNATQDHAAHRVGRRLKFDLDVFVAHFLFFAVDRHSGGDAEIVLSRRVEWFLGEEPDGKQHLLRERDEGRLLEPDGKTGLVDRLDRPLDLRRGVCARMDGEER